MKLNQIITGCAVAMAIALSSVSACAQKVYSTNYKYQADVKVYVTDKEYRADLLVYRTDREHHAKDNNGVWYFCKSAYQADRKIYFVDNEYQADLVIFFTDKEYRTGWKDASKKHLMYK
jgi:lipocalin